MKRLSLALLVVFSMASNALADSPDHAPDVRQAGKPNQIEPCIFDVPVIVSDPQDSRREEYRRIFYNAQRSLLAFAKQNGWAGLMKEPFVKQVEVYDSKAAFDRRIREVDATSSESTVPKTFVAAIEDGVLIIVSPEVFQDSVPRLSKAPGAYEKLMTHELAHRLHVRILNGDEQQMGPIWFFEGFATYAANQFPAKSLPAARLWQVIDSKNRDSYDDCNAAFRYSLEKAGGNLPDLVARGGKPDFVEWLKAAAK